MANSGRPIIFLDRGAARIIRPEPFSIESSLQDLLEEYPEILWLGQVIESPPKLATIGREVSVPSGGIDLLFLGSDGILTVVETKLKRNQQSRREVVAQILEYGSYVAKWAPEKVTETAQKYSAHGDSRFTTLGEWAGQTFGLPAEDDFETLVAAALKDGQVRMVICVDETPEPLRSLVTFVNSHSSYMLLALEVTSYPVGEQQHVVVPTLFGYTPESEKPTRLPAPQWDEPSFFQALGERNQPQDTAAARHILEWAEGQGLRLAWGRGRTYGTFYPTIGEHKPIAIYTDGHVEAWFSDMKSRPPFDDEARRREFWERLNQIPGVSIPVERLDSWGRLPLAALSDDVNMERFLNLLGWYFQEVRGS